MLLSITRSIIQGMDGEWEVRIDLEKDFRSPYVFIDDLLLCDYNVIISRKKKII